MSGPHPDPLDPLQNLEPPAVARISHAGAELAPLSLNEVIAMSTALSLKRIADALGGADVYALNALMENAGQAFALGMRGR